MSKWLNDFSIKYTFEHLMSKTDAMTLDAIIGVIDKMPENLIRCKDCKYSVEHAPFYLCFKAVGGVIRKADGFCDCGERKDEE